MTIDTLISAAKFFVDVLVLAVAGGYWAGELRARRQRAEPSPLSSLRLTDGPLVPSPSMGEVIRRLEKLERDVPETYVRMDLAREWLTQSQHERADLRALITATQRRLDDLVGT